MEIYEILKRIASCKTLQDFVDNSMDLLGNPMLILDRNMCVVACTEIDVPDWGYMYLKAHRYPPHTATESISWRSQIQQLLTQEQVVKVAGDRQKLSHLTKTLRVNDLLVGQIDVTAHFREFSPVDEQILEIISSQCANYLYSQMLQQQSGVTALDYYLQYILDGKKVYEESARHHLLKLDWRPGGYMYVLTASITERSSTIAGDVFLKMVERYDKILRHETYIFVLLSRNIPLDENELSLWRQLLRENNLRCGLSQSFSHISDLAKYFSQACDTLEIGKRIHQDIPLHCFSDCQDFLMILECSKHTDVLAFVPDNILELAQRDRDRNTGVMRTLKIYLDEGRSIQQTAAILHLHRNTVNYRLAKAAEELSIDFSDGRQVNKLQNALNILTYVNKPFYFPE